MSNIKLVDKGWLMWAFYDAEGYIGIDNVCKWLEEFITLGLTHEIIHLVLEKLEGYETTVMFDNIFGLIDATILLVPEENTNYSVMQRKRLKDFWKKR